jgi:hypothetical protein
LPFALRFTAGGSSAPAQVDGSTINDIMRGRYPYMFLSTLSVSFDALGGWVLAVAVAGLVWRWARGQIGDHDRVLCLFFLATLIASLGGAFAVEALARLSGKPFLAINLIRGFRNVFLVYYVYMGLLLADLARWGWRAGGRRRAWAVLGYAVVVALAGRHALQTLDGQEFIDAIGQSRAAILERYARGPLASVSRWARDATVRDALFHFCDVERTEQALRFAFLSERSVAASWKDAGFLWYANKPKLPEWWERMGRLVAACKARDTAQAVADGLAYGADYVVVPEGWPPVPLEPVYRDAGGYVVYDVREGLRPD